MSTTVAALAFPQDLSPISTTPDSASEAARSWERWRKAYDEWSLALRILNDLEVKSMRARREGMDEDAIRLLYSATALEQREEKAAAEFAQAQDAVIAIVPASIAEAITLAEAMENGHIDDEAMPVAVSSLAAGLRRLSAA